MMLLAAVAGAVVVAGLNGCAKKARRGTEGKRAGWH